MIAGVRPFKGEYETALVYSILNVDPEPLTGLRTGVPMGLEKIINKLLAKDPDERYQNVIELPVDLKNVDITTTGTSRIEATALTEAATPTSSVVAPGYAMGYCRFDGGRLRYRHLETNIPTRSNTAIC